MNDQVWLGLLTVALASVGWFVRMVWAKIADLERRALLPEFATFRGMDQEREKQWMYWRETVDKRLDANGANIRQNETRITRLERNGDGG